MLVPAIVDRGSWIDIISGIPARSRAMLFENPEGIPSFSPALRQRSYAGKRSQQSSSTLKALNRFAASNPFFTDAAANERDRWHLTRRAPPQCARFEPNHLLAEAEFVSRVL